MSSPVCSTDTMPVYGQRLLPKVVDDAGRDQPDHVLFYNPRQNDTRQGYDQITNRIFANGINRLCAWLETTLGGTARTFGYVASNDLRYFMIMIAAAKLGHRALLSSPRNSLDAHVSLIQESDCDWWITSSSDIDDSITENLISRLNIAHATVPELADLLRQDLFSRIYPYEWTFEQGRSDVLALLHTSGSTGLPKLVPLYLGTASAMDAMHLMEPIDGKRPSVVEWAGTKMLCAMPLFHTAGICFGLYGAVFFRWTVVLPSTGPLVQHAVEESLDSISLDSAFISPSVLQDISKSPRALQKLSTLKFVASAGGPIPASVGKAIQAHVPVFQIMGMTELQLLASVSTGIDDWEYFHFHPHIGFEMEPVPASPDDGEDDHLFQLVYIRNESLRLKQSIFVTFPHLDRWESKDLYSRHPKSPHLWKYEMRADDVIVLSNGEKFGPLAAEAKLIEHPMIRSAYIAGRQRFQAALLLRPTEDSIHMPDGEIIDKVWSAVQAVNASLPAFAQIHRDFVKIVRGQFALTPKGTVARKATEALFKKEIEDIYARPVDHQAASAVLPIDTASPQTLQDGIAEAVRAVVGIRRIGASDTLFGAGFDSLHVLRLARILRSALAVDVRAAIIYENPSIGQLSVHLWAQLHPEQHHQGLSSTYPFNCHNRDVVHVNGGQSRRNSAQADTISRMLADHAPCFRRTRIGSSTPKSEYVVLTGSTGSIGPFLLDRLSQNKNVAGIWCLNRRIDARQHQLHLARANGLSCDWDDGEKVKFFRCDISSPKTFGLGDLELQDVLDRATVIIHNAWDVNFNLSLPSFGPHILGLETLVDICRQTRVKVRFYFMSSISAALRSTDRTRDGRIDEAEITDLEAPINGYGASKWVAEHLLARAAEAGVLSLSVFRVGQVGGPVQTYGHGSMWSRKDWVPALIDASAYLQTLPSDLGLFYSLDWIPVDLLANILNQLMFEVWPRLGEKEDEEINNHQAILYYNLMNPTPKSWSDLLPTIKARIEAAAPAGSPGEIQVVTLKQWITELQDSEASIVHHIDAPPGTNGYSSGDAGSAKAQTGLALVEFFQMLDVVNSKRVRDDFESKDGPNDVSRHKIQWAMERAVSHSPILADLPAVSPAWMETWLDQWGYTLPS